MFTAEELCSLNSHDVIPPRSVRKAIFSLRLWQPVRQRRHSQRLFQACCRRRRRPGVSNDRSLTVKLQNCSFIVGGACIHTDLRSILHRFRDIAWRSQIPPPPYFKPPIKGTLIECCRQTYHAKIKTLRHFYVKTA